MANKNGLGVPKPSCIKTLFYRVATGIDQHGQQYPTPVHIDYILAIKELYIEHRCVNPRRTAKITSLLPY
jgi:hypothetical protein